MRSSRLQLAHDLITAGVVVRASGDNLHVTCQRGPMPAGLRDQLRERKPEVMAWLQILPGSCLTPTVCMALGLCHRSREGAACAAVEESICPERPSNQEVA